MYGASNFQVLFQTLFKSKRSKCVQYMLCGFTSILKLTYTKQPVINSKSIETVTVYTVYKDITKDWFTRKTMLNVFNC